jgi:type IV secretory pathway VirB4 component
MNARGDRIRAMLYAMQLGSRVAYFEQEKGFLSCLPYGRNALRTGEYPLILGSHEASSTFPFLSQTLFEAGGILEGITRTGSPVVVNWWGSARRNANRLIVGPSGSGKSFKVHMDIDRLFLRYGKKLCEQDHAPLPFQCIVVDIEREFRRHTRARGGQWIRLAPGTKQCINPFDLPQTHRRQTHQYVEYALADKIADLQALLDVMLADHDASGRGRLSSQEKGLLDQVLYEAYRRAGITNDPTTHNRTPPLMRNLSALLKSGVCGEDTTGLGSRLHRFVEGSLAGLFSGQTNVDLSAPLECFDIHDLPTDLRPIALFLLSSHVWNSSFGSSIPVLFIVDELASLFQYEEGRRFIEALFQRARKHNLSVVGVTQYVGLLEDSSIPTNSATTILMAQEAASLDKVQQIFHLSDAEVRELRTFGKGEALLLMGEQRLAVRFEASPQEYEMATSDPADLARAARQENTPKGGTVR